MTRYKQQIFPQILFAQSFQTKRLGYPNYESFVRRHYATTKMKFIKTIVKQF